MSSAEFVAINPFDLPEIRELLKNHLPKHALVQCIRVNRAWYASFLPSIWEDISLYPLSPGRESGPSPESVNNHRHLIRSLSFHYTIERAYSSRAFPNLGSLRLFDISPTTTQPQEEEKQTERSDIEILTLNPTLMHLKFSLTEPDWQAISELKHLKVLELISCAKICSNPQFWTVCAQLETLILTNANIPDLRSLPNNTVFEKLRTLDLRPRSGRVYISMSKSRDAANGF
ncbi:hypothetical protein BGZ58_008627 [Dissophora ornata]|nr:hypothetical protein BGZ58_008627 [Dissophora ornata]